MHVYIYRYFTDVTASPEVGLKKKNKCRSEKNIFVSLLSCLLYIVVIDNSQPSLPTMHTEVTKQIKVRLLQRCPY